MGQLSKNGTVTPKMGQFNQNIHRFLWKTAKFRSIFTQFSLKFKNIGQFLPPILKFSQKTPQFFAHFSPNRIQAAGDKQPHSPAPLAPRCRFGMTEPPNSKQRRQTDTPSPSVAIVLHWNPVKHAIVATGPIARSRPRSTIFILLIPKILKVHKIPKTIKITKITKILKQYDNYSNSQIY